MLRPVLGGKESRKTSCGSRVGGREAGKGKSSFGEFKAPAEELSYWDTGSGSRNDCGRAAGLAICLK
jgi:hypothetical protein